MLHLQMTRVLVVVHSLVWYGMVSELTATLSFRDKLTLTKDKTSSNKNCQAKEQLAIEPLCLVSWVNDSCLF